jgi:hypothetical protein
MRELAEDCSDISCHAKSNWHTHSYSNYIILFQENQVLFKNNFNFFVVFCAVYLFSAISKLLFKLTIEFLTQKWYNIQKQSIK